MEALYLLAIDHVDRYSFCSSPKVEKKTKLDIYARFTPFVLCVNCDQLLLVKARS